MSSDPADISTVGTPGSCVSTEDSALIYEAQAQQDGKEVPEDENVKAAILSVLPSLSVDVVAQQQQQIVTFYVQSAQKRKREQEQQELLDRVSHSKNALRGLISGKLVKKKVPVMPIAKVDAAEDVLNSFVSSLGSDSVDAKKYMPGIAFKSATSHISAVSNLFSSSAAAPDFISRDKRPRDKDFASHQQQQQPQQPLSQRYNARAHSQVDVYNENTHVYVSDLPSGADLEAIILELGVFGDILRIRLLNSVDSANSSYDDFDNDYDDGYSNAMKLGNGRAIVSYRTAEQAQDAVLSAGSTKVLGKVIGLKPSYISNVCSAGVLVSTRASVLWSRATGQPRAQYVSEVPVVTHEAPVLTVSKPVVLKWPQSQQAQCTIDNVAKYVALHGPSFEKLLNARGEYSFLKLTHPDHLFYRWRVRCAVQQEENFGPYQPVSTAPIVLPPDQNDRPRKQTEDHSSLLNQVAKALLAPESLQSQSTLAEQDGYVRDLDGSTQSVARASMKLVHFGEHAPAIIILYYNQIRQGNQPVYTLYGLSDLLHNANSDVPHASRFRDEIERSIQDLTTILTLRHAKAVPGPEKTDLAREFSKVISLWTQWGAVSGTKVANFLTKMANNN